MDLKQLEAKLFAQIEKINNSIQETGNEWNEKLATAAPKEELDKLQEKMQGYIEEVNKINEAVLKQGEAMAKIAKNTEKPVTFAKAFNESLKGNKEAFDEWRAGNGSSKFFMDVDFDVKAGETIDASEITSGTDFAMMVDGIGQIPVRQPFMKDLFITRPIGTEYLKYADQENIVRDAQNVIGCAPITTTTTISWIVASVQIKKVKDYINVCLDMMEDYSYVEGEVRGLIDSSVQLKTDEGLLLGDGTGTALNGVASQAATFAAATPGADYSTSVKMANLYDLICIVGAQISAAGQENKWFANVVVMNPRDAKLLKLEKDDNGQYLRPDFARGLVQSIDGIRIVENPLIPENEMYVMDSRQGTVYQRRGVGLEFSFENRQNFEEELVTVKAYERLNLLIRNVDANAFIHVPDIAQGIIDITAP